MYPQITADNASQYDQFDNPGRVNVATLLANLSRNLTTPIRTGGATGTTVDFVDFNAPARLQVTAVLGFVDVAPVGTGNVVTFNIKNGTTVIATGSVDVANSPAAGDHIAMTLSTTAADLIMEQGADLTTEFVTASGTITTPTQAHFQVEYNTIAPNVAVQTQESYNV